MALETVKAFGRLIGRFPFAGRVAIRPAFRKFRNAPKGERSSAFSGFSTLMLVMVGGHGWQARLGWLALKKGYLMKVHAFWQAIFIGYTAANLAVTFVQSTLLLWCMYVYFTGQHMKPGRSAEEPFTGRELMLMVVVTLGGQLLFMFAQRLVL